MARMNDDREERLRRGIAALDEVIASAEHVIYRARHVVEEIRRVLQPPDDPQSPQLPSATEGRSMPASSPVWSHVHEIVEAVNANGERTENLKGAICDLRLMKPVDQSRLLLELNVAVLALQELALLALPLIG
jgi:hypothetical protein